MQKRLQRTSGCGHLLTLRFSTAGAPGRRYPNRVGQFAGNASPRANSPKEPPRRKRVWGAVEPVPPPPSGRAGWAQPARKGLRPGVPRLWAARRGGRKSLNLAYKQGLRIFAPRGGPPKVGAPPAASLFAQAAPTPRARLAAAAQVPRHPTHASDGGAPSGNWRAEMRFPQIGLLGWDTSGRGRLRLKSAKLAGARTPKFAAGVFAFQCFSVCTLKH